jgi:hypothetical protein
MKVVKEAGEESEEGLGLELWTLLFVGVGENEDEDGENLGEVVHLRLLVVDTSSIAVVLDDIDDEPRECVQGLEREVELSKGHTLEVGRDTSFGANPEEERRYILRFENAVLREIGDKGDEAFLGSCSPLEHSDPVLEPHVQLLPHLLGLRLQRRSRCNVRRSPSTTQVLKKTGHPEEPSGKGRNYSGRKNSLFSGFAHLCKLTHDF